MKSKIGTREIVIGILTAFIIITAGFAFLSPKSQKNDAKKASEKTTQNTTVSKSAQVPTISPPLLKAISEWAPHTMLSSPSASVETTHYGKLKGLRYAWENERKKGSKNSFITKKYYDDTEILEKIGYKEDIKPDANATTATTWGYKKTENGKTQVVVFSYSTKDIGDSNNTTKPLLSMSIFVSNPFTEK